MEKKTCGTCLKEQPTKEFSKKQNNCKSCRNSKAKNKYDGDLRVEQYRRQKEKHFLDERTPVRNELMRELFGLGWDLEGINNKFVKLEEFNEMKENPEYEFVYYEHPHQALEGDRFEKYALGLCQTEKRGERQLRPVIYII